jgi:hypothetical protein
LGAELGGTSFMAMRLLSMLREACPAVQMIDLVEYNTPALLAQRLVCAVVLCVCVNAGTADNLLDSYLGFSITQNEKSDRKRASSFEILYIYIYTEMES